MTQHSTPTSLSDLETPQTPFVLQWSVTGDPREMKDLAGTGGKNELAATALRIFTAGFKKLQFTGIAEPAWRGVGDTLRLCFSAPCPVRRADKVLSNVTVNSLRQPLTRERLFRQADSPQQELPNVPIDAVAVTPINWVINALNLPPQSLLLANNQAVLDCMTEALKKIHATFPQCTQVTVATLLGQRLKFAIEAGANNATSVVVTLVKPTFLSEAFGTPRGLPVVHRDRQLATPGGVRAVLG